MTDSIQEHQYGEDAQTNKRYDHLTEPQKTVVDTLVEHRDEHVTQEEIGREAGVTGSYVSYVQRNFPHIIENRKMIMRQPATDGGETPYTIRLSPSKTFKVIKSLPPELSRPVFDQVRKQDTATTSGGGENMDDLFDEGGSL